MARWDKGDTGSTIPEWFFEAIETEYSTHAVEVDECDVVYQKWGDDPSGEGGAKPALLLIHGMFAHSHWWDFIAPAFLDNYRVAAMNLTGMGDSDYRYDYNSTTFAEEIVAVCDDAGFGSDVAVVAHSFGGAMAVKAAGLFPERFGSLILVDSGIRNPDDPPPEHLTMMMGGQTKVYPDKHTAIGRFRLQPPQPCENQYVMDYIARHSVMAVDGGGWSWKYDEDLSATMKGGERQPEEYEALSLPFGLIYGADSELFSRSTLDYMRTLVPQEFPAVALENAQHHVFLDQPLAFIDALKGMLTELKR
ncbi:MAG: alpha/beta hydrolase [Pseudomonadota bacterium]